MTNDLLSLRSFVEAQAALPEADLQAFLAIWKPFSAKRKEVLTMAGESERYLYFVSEGVQRVYYLDDENREATLVFTYAPSFGGILDSILLQTPSRYYFETLTASEFLRTSVIDFNACIEKYPSVGTFVRKGLSHVLAGLLERQVDLQCFSSEERFKKLLQRSPHILQLVPHKYLANYLGMDATNFSKHINKVKI